MFIYPLVEVEPPEVSEFFQTTRDTYIIVMTEEEMRRNSSESGEDIPLKMGEILLLLGEEEDQLVMHYIISTYSKESRLGWTRWIRCQGCSKENPECSR